MYFCFIDYAKVFDSVDHNKQWKTLKEMGIQDRLTCLLRNLCACQEATVRTLYGITDWFKIDIEVPQGYILSPCLFNLHEEHITWNAGPDELQARIKIARRNINNLIYENDTILMAENEEELKSLKEESAKTSLKLNIEKTKIMASYPITSWQIEGEKMEAVSDFTADGDWSHEIRRQQLLGRKSLTKIDSVLQNKDITLLTKVCIVKAVMFPIVI